MEALHDALPDKYHETFDQCFELLVLDHPNRDHLKSQVKILLEHAKRDIADRKASRPGTKDAAEHIQKRVPAKGPASSTSTDGSRKRDKR